MSQPSPDYFFFFGHNPDKTPERAFMFSQWYQEAHTTFEYKAGMFLPYDVIEEPAAVYKNREQYMMYHKALLFAQTHPICKKILQESDPSKIKKLGRAIPNFNQADWDEIKYQIVVNGNYLQFTQNAPMREALLATGTRVLVEASKSDKIWGIGYLKKDALANIANWGENLLGKALTEVKLNLLK